MTNMSKLKKNEKKVFKYIDLLKKDSFGEFIDPGYTDDGIRIMPYINYSRTVKDFIKDFSESEYVRYDYASVFPDLVDKAIDTLDKEQLCNLITGYIRADRFCEGFLYEQLKNGELLCALEQLEKLC